MAHRFFTLASGTFLGVLLTSATLFSCQHLGNHSVAATQASLPAATGPAGESSSLPTETLRAVLADLAKSHNDHVKLATWVGTPFLRPVDPPFKPFFSNMGKQNKELRDELQAWAKAHRMSLAVVERTGLEGAAQKIMDKRQEDLVRNDDKTDFQHHILVQMYTDYEWNLAQLQALIPQVSDRALKSYLQKAEKMYADGSREILELLRRYRFQ